LAETTDVVVVGAGPAGLAVAACLGKVGLDFIILERNLHVASSWRRHYERLHLHTIKQLSSLPYCPYPKDYPRYVPRNLLINIWIVMLRTLIYTPVSARTCALCAEMRTFGLWKALHVGSTLRMS
jgi:cation diffusion facilitator CzcD-associated flavoprotein CzcO